MRQRGQGQDVVDDGGTAEQSLVRGQWRLGANFSALPLDGIEQRGLLAADIGPGANPHFHPKRSEEHTSEPQSLMRISYAAFSLQITSHITDLHQTRLPTLRFPTTTHTH